MQDIVLLTSTNTSKNSDRQQEISQALKHNNDYFSSIEVIYQDDRCEYSTLLNLANEKYRNRICVIANVDIMFNDTIYLCEKFLEDNMIMSLTRYNDNQIEQQGTFNGSDFYSYSQDAWIFKAGTLDEFDSHFAMGTPKCENRFLLEALMSGVKVVNPSLDITTQHNHKSNIRQWKEEEAYQGSLCFPKVTTLENCHGADCLVSHEHADFWWKKDNYHSRTLGIDEYVRYNPEKNTSYIDTNFYLDKYNLKDTFYQPYCKNQDIPNTIRASYHYDLYGYRFKHETSLESWISRVFDIRTDSKFLTVDIDKFLPPHKEYEDTYNQKILKGKAKAANSKIAVVSLARNCEDHLSNSITEINKIECEKLSMFIFENDSEDSTKYMLELASERYDNLTIKCINNNREHLTDRSESRTVALAEYRNLCLDWVKDHCKDYDYTIVLDLDSDLGFSVAGIYNSIGWMDNLDNVGGIASYSLLLDIKDLQFGLLHYDSFAARMRDWLRSEEKDRNNLWFRTWHPPVGSTPIHMYSCFGGLAIYKTEAFLSGRYSGELGSEHVQFHKDLYENGYKMYLNPSSRFFSVYDKDSCIR